jgi:hypothetical protein
MSLRLTQQSIPGLRIPFFSVTMYNFVMSVRQNTFSFLLPYTAILIGLNLLKNAWIAILLYHFLILVYLAVSGHLRDFKLIFHGWNSRLFLGSLGMSIIAGPALFILWNSMKLDNSNLLSSLAHLKLDGLSWVLFMPYFALFHPVLEEVFWRSNPDNSKWNGCQGYSLWRIPRACACPLYKIRVASNFSDDPLCSFTHLGSDLC